ncbi:MAG: 23S rRNA (guanosine(2251)-2'-O)-methyltransferase RlmB [Burkholderiaceae bacterium]|nr:23S rRNA (guanosine(2251)-2'-O)-methyltransferase RlmB [Burkholderiaceae bacterium]MCD8518059.1 23S rRNA (guanosine(2251)-2'-O)-methyltransferase RlmB [Burkholderiaceae bacterium]MCD8565140.1 23S rRNA (guanosine(2251)-2'-O)-methyltransferase RlmB [Burkholderiaceae bacterium]
MSQSKLLAGFHAVQARVRQAPGSVRDVYVDAARRDKRMTSLMSSLKEHGVTCHVVDGERLEQLAQGVRHQGVVAIVEALSLAQDIDEVFDSMKSAPLFLVLDGVTDPHNLGACLRTADAAGVHAVIAPKDRAVGLSPVVERVACGATQSVPYIMVTNLARQLRDLKDRGVWLIGTDERAQHSLHEVDQRGPVAWVMGAEGAGMRRLTRELCDHLVHIPMAGSVESLNVSVATGVCLYETVRQRTTPSQ